MQEVEANSRPTGGPSTVVWTIGTADFEYDKITFLFQLKQDNERFKLNEIPVKKKAKIGFAMPINPEMNLYYSEVRDTIISWAVSPILATDSEVQPRA